MSGDDADSGVRAAILAERMERECHARDEDFPFEIAVALVWRRERQELEGGLQVLNLPHPEEPDLWIVLRVREEARRPAWQFWRPHPEPGPWRTVTSPEEALVEARRFIEARPSSGDEGPR